MLAVHRFYNPGTKIEEMLGYDNPLLDARDCSLRAYFQLRAEEKSFFTVPRELKTALDSSIYPQFDKSILGRHAARGVVLVDKNAENVDPDEPIATTDQEAKQKGDAKWSVYLRTTAQEWMDHIARCREQSLQPKPAQGFHKYALTALGIVDPADTVDNMLSTRASDGEVGQMKKELAELRKLISEKK